MPKHIEKPCFPWENNLHMVACSTSVLVYGGCLFINHQSSSIIIVIIIIIIIIIIIMPTL